MAMTLGKLITLISIFIILVPLLAYLATFGNNAPTYQELSNSTYHNYSSAIVNVSLQTIRLGANTTQNLTGSPAAQSFAYAFIFPGFGSIVTALFQIPATISLILTPLISSVIGQGVFPGSSGQAFITLIISTISSEIIMFLSLLILSLWMKYPAWS